ncbi:MAG: uncharacterized protein QOF48_2557 [Verrucomicrobiota bacterium]|jgi:uncharacterized protein (TIGR01777 family)
MKPNASNPRRLILAGGSGFLGGVLANWFAARQTEVVILTRTPRRDAPHREVGWDGRTLDTWQAELEGAAALVNLAGRSVDCRYHSRNRRLIMDSRVDSTRVLGEAIARCKAPPPVWLNSSTATIYKHTHGSANDEAGGQIGSTPEARDKFSVEVAVAWERVFEEAPTPATRKVALRSAMVLGRGANSVFPVLSKLTRRGLGGRMGDGRQFVSWIHQVDFCRAIEWLIDHEEMAGPVNLAAPNPVCNSEMMRAFRELCGMRFGVPSPYWMLEAGAFFLRTETELIIKSRRVIPGRLLASGFQFDYPLLRPALEQLKEDLTKSR